MAKSGSLFYKPKKNDQEITKKRWRVLPILWKAAKRVCMMFGLMFIISLVMISISTTMLLKGAKPKPLPKDMVLLLELEDGFSEVRSKASFMDPFPFSKPQITKVIDIIERAKDDGRVRGIVVSMKGASVSTSHTQEIRGAIDSFKESGKFTKIYAPSYANSTGLGLYYFASAFDEIWMQPVGQLSVTGGNFEMPFGKSALEKIGVKPDFLQREGYKSAMENLTNSEMSDKNREMMSSILASLSTQMMTQVSTDRTIPVPTLKTYVDKGILTGKEALNAKLIDRLDYADVLMSEVRQATKGDPEDSSLKVVTFQRYGQAKKAVVGADKAGIAKSNVALIYAVGAIGDEEGGNSGAGAEEISAAIREAYNNKSIEAIVLRVDSPGGSPTASETIRRALVKAKEKNKKIIVSMGSMAASGGYWISADADEIIALPSTLTGSIGVVMGKFDISGVWEKLGVNWESIKYGENSALWSPNSEFNEQERARMNVLIDDTYNSFLEIVANGRSMPKEKVREVAQGRAWTGEQAVKIGLVDKLGGLDFALDRTAEIIGKADRSQLNVIQMPREKTPIEEFVSLLEGQVSLGYFMKSQSGLLKDLSVFSNHYDMIKHSQGLNVYGTDLEAFR